RVRREERERREGVGAVGFRAPDRVEAEPLGELHARDRHRELRAGPLERESELHRRPPERGILAESARDTAPEAPRPPRLVRPMPPAGESVIRARGVTKRFGARVAVRDLDLDVPPGVCFGLLGPNGAGKTTALRMIYGVTRPTAGAIEVFGI